MVLKELILTVSMLEGYGGLQRTDFKQFLIRGCGGLEITDFFTVSDMGRCGGLERPDFEQFLLWEGVVVLKELILNSF